MGENTMLVDGVECEIMSTREKESVFKMSVPILHPFWAALFGFLNLVPGLGTFLGALTLMCFGRSSYETNLEAWDVFYKKITESKGGKRGGKIQSLSSSRLNQLKLCCHWLAISKQQIVPGWLSRI
eukprot:GFUD01139410.1.p1 GENE.GFUD01139410.1~~GFUD01139410.1.p1  ORF type:complete len:126 (+),score=5.51 GFUD01139410.1:86-463(+)